MKGKPRHNNENQLSKPCNREHRFNQPNKEGRFLCNCYDGTYTKDDGSVHTILEMSEPWCNPDAEDGCKCNPYNCIKMKNRWFASLSRDKQERLESGKADCWSNEITRRS